MNWLYKEAESIADKCIETIGPEAPYSRQHRAIAEAIKMVAREFAQRAASKAYVDAMKNYGLIPASELEQLVDEALEEADRDE